MKPTLVLVLAACTTTSDTRVHVTVTAADPSIAFDRYQILVGDAAALAQPLAAVDVEVPNQLAGSAQMLDVWGLDAGQQIAFGTTSVTPIEHQTVTAEVTLEAASCGASCNLGDSECSGSGTSACQLIGSCLAFGPPTACASGEVCAAGACGAPPSCAQDGAACDDGNPCTIDDTCTNEACTGTPKCTSAPANAAPTCGSDGTCDFACTTGYMRSGSSCVSPNKRVFLTAELWNGNLGGVAGADAKCQAAATAAGVSGTYMAWISDDSTSPSGRLAHATVPYELVDGTLVAASWTALTNQNLEHAIDMTETGETVVGSDVFYAWTASYDDGTMIDLGSTCSEWTTSAGDPNFDDQGYAGDPSAVDGYWSDDGPIACDQMGPLYCFEQ